MESEKDKELLISYLNNELTAKEKEAFEKFLAGSAEMRQESDEAGHIWEMMGQLPEPEPSAALPVKFYAMLDTFKASEADKRNVVRELWEKFQQMWSFQPKFQMAYSLVILMLGLGLGYFVNEKLVKSGKNEEIQNLSSEVQDMKQMMMLSLLENPSATERIRAVSYTNEIKAVDKKVIEALLTTLNNDSNDNVRLMTLEALVKLADEPMVREGLVQSITHQESPLVQSALADVMVKLQEKRAIKPLKKLLKQQDLNGFVKSKIESSIHEII